jgi:hypothetical protein
VSNGQTGANAASHKLQAYGFSPVCVCLCFAKLPDPENTTSHKSQANSFWPCAFVGEKSTCQTRKMPASHTSQTYGVSPVRACLCTATLPDREKNILATVQPTGQTQCRTEAAAIVGGNDAKQAIQQQQRGAPNPETPCTATSLAATSQHRCVGEAAAAHAGHGCAARRLHVSCQKPRRCVETSDGSNSPAQASVISAGMVCDER